MAVSRRTFLKLLGGAALAGGGSSLAWAAPGRPSPRITDLRNTLTDLIGDLAIGLDLRQIDPDSGDEYLRVQINADQLYPVASCFKTWLALYYLWYTPEDQQTYAEGSPVYSTVVFSNNTRTGTLIEQVGARINRYGNALEKFNDFLLFDVGLRNGLYRWSWEGNPVQDLVDTRFTPSLINRHITLNDERFLMDNLTTAADLADGYAFLLNPPDATYQQAAARTLELCAIPAAAFPSPIERAFEDAYIGKDGVLPADRSIIGRVINDAGIITVGDSTYILSFLCAGEGEWVGINILREVAAILRDFEDIS